MRGKTEQRTREWEAQAGFVMVILVVWSQRMILAENCRGTSWKTDWAKHLWPWMLKESGCDLLGSKNTLRNFEQEQQITLASNIR